MLLVYVRWHHCTLDRPTIHCRQDENAHIDGQIDWFSTSCIFNSLKPVKVSIDNDTFAGRVC